MEKNRPLLLLSAAILIALVTSVIAYQWIKKETAVKEGALEAVPAVVASVDLPWGTALNPGMVKTIPFLKGSLTEGEYFPNAAALNGRVLIMPVRANEPIMRSRLAPDSMATGGVAAVVDPAKRAMAVKVDKVIGVSGFVRPGNRVDVLVSLQRRGSNNDDAVTKIVLQNIPVLAIGAETEQKGKNERPVQVDVITLELTPEEAEKLALSTTEGKIQLALRNFTSKDEVSTKGATISSLLSGGAVPVQAVKRSGAPKPVMVTKQDTGFNVEILMGKEKSIKTFAGE
jgi:pilus assembly protein CpaB